jgi:DNA-binding NarL/FixJ family response regulator
LRRLGLSGTELPRAQVGTIRLRLLKIGAVITRNTRRVVVLTSSHEERDMVASYRLGVNAYVVKPVDFHEFVNAIRELGVFWAIINEPPPGSIKKQ